MQLVDTLYMGQVRPALKCTCSLLTVSMWAAWGSGSLLSPTVTVLFENGLEEGLVLASDMQRSRLPRATIYVDGMDGNDTGRV